MKSYYKDHEDRILRVLELSPEPMRCKDVAAIAGIPPRITAGILSNVWAKKMDNFFRITVGVVNLYALGEEKIPEKKRGKKTRVRIDLVDLYRGWFNPKTGITGSKLGVDIDESHRRKNTPPLTW